MSTPTSTSLLSLSDDLIGCILLYAPIDSVLALAGANSVLRQTIGEHEYLWQNLVERDWPGVRREEKTKTLDDTTDLDTASQPSHDTDEPMSSSRMRSATAEMDTRTDTDTDANQPSTTADSSLEDSTSLTFYRQQSIRFGRTSEHYPRLYRIWERIETWLDEHEHELPAIRESLLDGATSIQQLDEAIRQYHLAIKLTQVKVRRQWRRGFTADELRAAKKHPTQSTTVTSNPGEASFEAAIGLAPVLETPTAETKEMDGFTLHEVNLPNDYLCSLMIHQGQSPIRQRSDLMSGLFGGYHFYDFVVNFRLATLEQALALAAELYDADAVEYIQYMDRQRKKVRSTSAKNGSSHEHHEFMDPDFDILSYHLDSYIPVTSVPHSMTPVFFWLDPSTGSILRRQPDGDPHIVGESFTDWLDKFASALEQDRYACHTQYGINRFPQRDPCGSDTTTNGIRVEVSVLYVPEQCNENQRFFTYHIRMTHDGSTATRATLVSRHWEIDRGNGEIEVVNGPGVIGAYPSLYPGCPPFTYESCCPIEEDRGRMWGTFQFKDDFTGKEFDVVIQPFTFDINRNYC